MIDYMLSIGGVSRPLDVSQFVQLLHERKTDPSTRLSLPVKGFEKHVVDFQSLSLDELNELAEAKNFKLTIQVNI